MKTFRVTFGARCYDTYDVKAETPEEAVEKARNFGADNEDVEEHELGEIAGSQDYKDEDLICVRELETDKDVTKVVQERLERRAGRVRILVEAYGYNEESDFDPQAAEIMLTAEFLQRVKQIAAGISGVDAFAATVLPSTLGIRSPRWYKVLDDPKGEFVLDESENHALTGVPEELLEEMSAEGHNLVVDHDGEFRWRAKRRGTNWTWCTRTLRLPDAWAILEKERRR